MGCEDALKKAESTIASTGIHFDDLFDAIRAKHRRRSDQSRHVFAMGYPTFYSETAIGSCQSWQINWPAAGRKELRHRLNLIERMDEHRTPLSERAIISVM
jgi:hypothetical protein